MHDLLALNHVLPIARVTSEKYFSRNLHPHFFLTTNLFLWAMTSLTMYVYVLYIRDTSVGKNATWTLLLSWSHSPKMTTPKMRRQRQKDRRRGLSSWVTFLRVCCKNPPSDPFVGNPTGGGVKQTKKSYFLFHYVPTNLPISPSHNSFIEKFNKFPQSLLMRSRKCPRNRKYSFYFSKSKWFINCPSQWK